MGTAIDMEGVQQLTIKLNGPHGNHTDLQHTVMLKSMNLELYAIHFYDMDFLKSILKQTM